MTNEQKSSQLYRIAYQCAENRSTGRCKPENYCGNCPLNVSLYLADQREAVLIKTNAALDYGKVRQYQQEEAWKEAILAILALVGIIWFASSIKSCTEPKDKPADTVTKTVRAATLADIPVTIGYVLANVCDMNGDNLVNCIDYSVLFYKYFPGECNIIVNRNPSSGMHHMFVAVWVGNKWVYVEPQGPQFDYDPKRVWGDYYNPYYNNITTAAWAVYARQIWKT